MEINLYIGDEVERALGIICKIYNVTSQRILMRAPGIIAGIIQTIEETEGHLSYVAGNIGYGVNLRTIDDYVNRQEAYSLEVEASGGTAASGLVTLTLGDEYMAECNQFIKANSHTEAFAYSLNMLLALLMGMLDKPEGSTLAIISGDGKNMYSVKF